jgi:hypothetical protein
VDDSRDRLVRKGSYIDGSFVRPERVDGYINGVNPGDRADILGRFAFSEDAVEDAVEHATIASRIWRHVPLAERVAAVRRFRQASNGALCVPPQPRKNTWCAMLMKATRARSPTA